MKTKYSVTMSDGTKLDLGIKFAIVHRWGIWVRNWLELVCAVCNILTFTAYRPWWDYKYIAVSFKRDQKIINSVTGKYKCNI